MIDESKINKNGLYDNEGLCDSLIVDCNNAVKTMIGGNYILFCNLMVQMVQKLANLKEGIRNDADSLKGEIEDLKRMNKSIMDQIKKEGAEP